MDITWGTKVINVYKTDMLLIQSNPTPIYQLDLNDFRSNLNILQDDEEGMSHLTTHQHNPALTIGGVTLSQTIELINGYTVTFEDGQYAVNLIGANSNVGDKVNVNQVSVRTANSAGLVTSQAIEFGEYLDGIIVDTGNITGKATNGTIYYTGTLRRPVDNIADAIIIDSRVGIKKFKILGDVVIGSGNDISEFTIQGTSHVQNNVTILDSANVLNCVFSEIKVSGVLDGDNDINNCIIGEITYFNGHIHNSGLIAEITLAGGIPSVLSSCKTIDPNNPPSINMNGTGQSLSMPDYSGLLTIRNMASGFVGIDLSGGEIILETASMTGGVVNVSGSGVLRDELGNLIETGLWNGITIINTLSEGSINTVDKVWSYER